MAEQAVNVLIVDDDQKNLVAYTGILQELNVNLVLARSGREALKQVLDKPFAAIIMDVSMPDMDGFETASLIRQRPASQTTPMIFATASYKEDVQIVTGYALGAVDYLIKPLVPEILRSKITAFVELFRRIDDVRQLNGELAARVSELTSLNKELESFSYSISHDLRAPLRAIEGFSHILLTDHAPELPDEVKEYLSDIRANALQMGRLIDDLLNFSKLGRQPLKKKTVDPSWIVNECIRELEPERRGRNVDFVVDDLAPCRGDPALLKQVWMNLLSNALKYTSKRPAAVVEIGSTNGESSGQIAYFVRDNGVGFDMQYSAKLFGVFQRMHRAEDFPGTGVGLAIVKRIVERHGGRIWADAEPDRGATFSFTLENDSNA
ncbi:MAG TPA: ATP-binding protein [Planctomycetaceae bacterium]|nr:ATP-binding protein [Planctomycetaceae bacterium]